MSSQIDTPEQPPAKRRRRNLEPQARSSATRRTRRRSAAATCAPRASTAPLDQRGAVGDAPARGPAASRSGNPTSDAGRGRRPAPPASAGQGRRRRVQEIPTLEQVLRRVAGQRQLRKNHQLRAALLAPAAVAVEHQAPVALEIADRRVDLAERDLHTGRFYLQRSRRSRRGAKSA